MVSMIIQATPEAIERAAALLRAGDIIAFPTETVFGLGADARNADAVEKIFALKNRPRTKPFAVMVHTIEQAQDIAVFDQRALTLAHTMWPGPLSLVLPLRDGHGIAPNALAGNPTVALRMPSHPVALDLLRAFNAPLAAPSANPSGGLSATTALDIAREFGADGPSVLSDATKLIGIESTILDLSGDVARILRQGAVSRDQIAAHIGAVEVVADDAPTLKLKTPLRLNAVDVKAGEALLAFGGMSYIGAEGIGFARDMPQHLWRNLSAEGDLHQAAANLYSMLSALDNAGATGIAVMPIPDVGLGATLNARLRKMTGKSIS